MPKTSVDRHGSQTRGGESSQGRLAGKRLTAPLKWHGGKSYLAKQIIALMPPHRHYVEPFFGGGAVLFRKNPEGISEVISDINGDLTNFFKVLQREKLFAKFARRMEATPFSRAEWEEAARRLREEPDASRVSRAIWFFILTRMSLAGRMASFTGITKTRTRGGMNAEANAWLGAVAGLPDVHERLQRVLIETRPATELLRGHDVEACVLYCDPPYPHTTRTAPAVYGRFEMSDADHRQFLKAARSVKHAHVLISGYRCEMYDRLLHDWHCTDFDVANHSAGGKTKARRGEVVWTNYEPPRDS